MAVLMMMAHHNGRENDVGKEGEKPIFHDFLGTSCSADSSLALLPNKQQRQQQSSVAFGSEMRLLSETSTSLGASSGGGHATVSAASDLGSGRKRSNSDSIFLGWARDRTPQIGQDPLESSHLMRILNRNNVGERIRGSHDEDVFFGMQPPRPTSTSRPMLQPSGSGRMESFTSKWERSIPMSAGPTSQNQRLGQFAAYADKISSSRYKDSNAGPSIISQPAADEGSRTGIKGSGILSAINTSSAVNTSSVPRDRNLSGVLLSGSTLKSGTQIAAPEPSNAGSRHGLASVSRQMTIFYAGQAHVFDDVHPNKADVIMALAGSNGGSWSTTYSSKSRMRPSPIETSALNAENGSSFGNLTLPQEAHGNPLIPGNSSHALSQGAGIPTTPADTASLSSGDNQGNMIPRDVRTPGRAAEPDIEGKREV